MRMPKLKQHFANAGTVAVERLVALTEVLEDMDIPTESLEPVREAVAAVLDALPIDYKGATRKGVKFFALVGNEWWVAHEGVAVTDQDDPLVGGLRWKMLAENGSLITQGYSKPHEWAQAATDGTVDYHWLA